MLLVNVMVNKNFKKIHSDVYIYLLIHFFIQLLILVLYLVFVYICSKV